MNNSKHLIYNASSGCGLGHILTAIAVFADYAQRTGRQFHVNCRSCNLAIDPGSDIDPLFSQLFGLAPDNPHAAQFSYARCTQAIAASGSFLLVGNGNRDIPTSFPEHPELHGLNATHMRDFRPLLLNHTDTESDCIIVHNVSPFSALRKELDFFSSYPAPWQPSGELKHEQLQGMPLERCLGIHIRHGNGEFLHGRREGGSEAFDHMVNTMISTAQQLAAESDLEIIAFSDSTALLEQLNRDYGVHYVATGVRPTEAWKEHLRTLQARERAQTIRGVLQDFYALTQCARVVCGSSLFTTAAFIFSGHRNFTKIKE